MKRLLLIGFGLLLFMIVSGLSPPQAVVEFDGGDDIVFVEQGLDCDVVADVANFENQRVTEVIIKGPIAQTGYIVLYQREAVINQNKHFTDQYHYDEVLDTNTIQGKLPEASTYKREASFWYRC